MGYSGLEVELLRLKAQSGGSPSRELILDWSHQNPTVSDLYHQLIQHKFVAVAKLLEEYSIYSLILNVFCGINDFIC